MGASNLPKLYDRACRGWWEESEKTVIEIWQERGDQWELRWKFQPPSQVWSSGSCSLILAELKLLLPHLLQLSLLQPFPPPSCFICSAAVQSLHQLSTILTLFHKLHAVSRLSALHSFIMAKSIPSMPNEIPDKILSFSSNAERLQARLISRELYAISTVFLFRLKRFYISGETGEKFRNMLAAKHLADHVRDLVIGGPPVRQSKSWKIQTMSLYAKISQLHINSNNFDFKMASDLDDLCKLEHLPGLAIHFGECNDPRSSGEGVRLVAFRRDILARILTPLISSRSIKAPIRNLWIADLPSYDEPSLTTLDGFTNLLRRLRFLKLEIQSGRPMVQTVRPKAWTGPFEAI